MVKIIFVTHDGKRHEVEAEEETTLMETALKYDIPSIEAECGGACACATCHVYIDPDFTDKVGGAEPMEEDMLDFAYAPNEKSRLSCQIRIEKKLEGLIVHLPERQA